MKYRITMLMLSGLMVASAVNASSTTGTLTIATTIGPGMTTCTVSTTGINFPYVDDTTNTNGNGDVTVNCASGHPYTISLDAGMHFYLPPNYLTGARYVADNANDALAYYLSYDDGNQIRAWADGILVSGSPVSDIGTGSPQTHTLIGTL
jgi:spore coat protein U-like protein